MPFDEAFSTLPRPKFQHRYLVPALLFVLTLGSTTLLGWYHYLAFLSSTGAVNPALVRFWPGILTGLWYSVPLLLILGAHEFGHYAYCRKHNVDASLPFFLPMPVVLTGTLGAVIRIKDRFPSMAALFDIAIAGPIAGFVMLLPFLYFGVRMSAVVKFPPDAELIFFGEPLLFKLLAKWQFGTLPAGSDITLHPMGFAAWFGMLATALNLVPFGQLDGGHLSYSVFRQRAGIVSKVTLALTLLLTAWSLSWISMAIMMTAMAFFLGFGHPHVDDATPLDSRRRLLAVFALVMFVLCFTPVPIDVLLPTAQPK